LEQYKSILNSFWAEKMMIDFLKIEKVLEYTSLGSSRKVAMAFSTKNAGKNSPNISLALYLDATKSI